MSEKIKCTIRQQVYENIYDVANNGISMYLDKCRGNLIEDKEITAVEIDKDALFRSSGPYGIKEIYISELQKTVRITGIIPSDDGDFVIYIKPDEKDTDTSFESMKSCVERMIKTISENEAEFQERFHEMQKERDRAIQRRAQSHRIHEAHAKWYKATYKYKHRWFNFKK